MPHIQSSFTELPVNCRRTVWYRHWLRKISLQT